MYRNQIEIMLSSISVNISRIMHFAAENMTATNPCGRFTSGVIFSWWHVVSRRQVVSRWHIVLVAGCHWAYCLRWHIVWVANCLGGILSPVAYCLWWQIMGWHIVPGHNVLGHVVSGHHVPPPEFCLQPGNIMLI